MKRWFIILALCSSAVWAGEAPPRAEDPQVEARLVVLAEELRCLVCQNESLASSNAELAEDLRREVRKLIRQGMTDAEIKTYLVERYGDFVLYRPDVKPLTWPLWFGPFAILILAVWGLWRYLRHRKALVHQRMSDADNAQAESLLKE
ncbi:MAG: cytochrome c-type biogenesis protein CcmH [Limnohabitans sp.]|jgi:cytochrome c-type biogenesis protein CcmH|nr:cytochrome c-type biogenesis protein CcmH [Limnohabitans sp.]MBP8020837.1 cytochrome c-type biogenesis protein CcmH [Limnohabitans sp.]